MFKLSSNPTFAHDIDVKLPVDGGFEVKPLRVRYRWIDIDRLEGFDMNTLDGQKAFCDAVVAGFEGVTGDDDKPIADTAELAARMIGIPFIRAAVMQGYQAALQEALRKN